MNGQAKMKCTEGCWAQRPNSLKYRLLGRRSFWSVALFSFFVCFCLLWMPSDGLVFFFLEPSDVHMCVLIFVEGYKCPCFFCPPLFATGPHCSPRDPPPPRSRWIKFETTDSSAPRIAGIVAQYSPYILWKNPERDPRTDVKKPAIDNETPAKRAVSQTGPQGLCEETCDVHRTATQPFRFIVCLSR